MPQMFLQSTYIFNSIETGHCIPHQVLELPGYGQIPFTTVGDAAFPSRSWLIKAFPDCTKDAKGKNFNTKLRGTWVVSEHAYNTL